MWPQNHHYTVPPGHGQQPPQQPLLQAPQTYPPAQPIQRLGAITHGAAASLVAPMAASIALNAQRAAVLDQEVPRENLIPTTTTNSDYNLPAHLYTAIKGSRYYQQLLTDYPSFEDIIKVLSEVIFFCFLFFSFFLDNV